MSHHIELRIIRNGAYPVVQVEGDINRNGYEKGVIVDLKGAEHIDGTGVSILMEAFEVAQNRNRDFILTGLN